MVSLRVFNRVSIETPRNDTALKQREAGQFQRSCRLSDGLNMRGTLGAYSVILADAGVKYYICAIEADNKEDRLVCIRRRSKVRRSITFVVVEGSGLRHIELGRGGVSFLG